jgi:predicted  nucleic acid-binding Zn-ribbon protein
MLVIITIALFAVIGTAIFIIKNLLLQLEALEDRVIFYEESFDTIREQVLNTEIELKELDIRGAFESDDEVGFVFKQIKELSSDLNRTVQEIYESRN